MKRIHHIITLLFYSAATFSQVPAGEKIKAGSEKLNQYSGKVNQNVQDASVQVQSTVANAKAIIRVFEPIFRFRLKAKGEGIVQDPINSVQQPQPVPPVETPVQPGIPPVTEPAPMHPLQPENSFYNNDGSANLGNQNNEEFGSYVDVMRGEILDDISVVTETGSVDLIFTATDYFGSAPAYALLTPAYVKNDLAANYYFRGPRYKDPNIPPRAWQKVNESEVALTNISGQQFERIQNNNQLMAIISQTRGFKNYYESRTKIGGKVFAIKTEMGNRTCYGLMYVMDHFGTTGSNGYLKIKLKVTGFDLNGDGYPDNQAYQN